MRRPFKKKKKKIRENSVPDVSKKVTQGVISIFFKWTGTFLSNESGNHITDIPVIAVKNWISRIDSQRPSDKADLHLVPLKHGLYKLISKLLATDNTHILKKALKDSGNLDTMPKLTENDRLGI